MPLGSSLEDGGKDNGRDDTTLRVSKELRDRFFIEAKGKSASQFLPMLLELWKVRDLIYAKSESREYATPNKTG